MSCIGDATSNQKVSIDSVTAYTNKKAVSMNKTALEGYWY